MITERDIRIEYDKVFEVLPEIMGIPMKMFRGRWYASRKMDGSYSERPDKLVCRKVRDGIQILEQGGEALTLFNWMLKYGGCNNRFEAKMKLVNMSLGVMNITIQTEEDKPSKFVPIDYLNRSYERRFTHQDNFTGFLWSTFGHSLSEIELRKYMVGSVWQKIHKSDRYENATQFWYINRKNEICHDKVVLYKPDGHRDHEFGGGRGFTKAKGYSSRCFFGEHLLKHKKDGEKVYLVESEKTAIIASLFFRKGIWLATGGKCYLKRAATESDWVFIADYDAWEYWNDIAKQSKCPKWWEAYSGYKPGDHDDIGDLILNHLIKK